MPTKYKICKHLNNLNAHWNLSSTPREAEGVQIFLQRESYGADNKAAKKWSSGQGHHYQSENQR